MEAVASVSGVAVVADSDGDVVGGHLVADLSGGLDDGLDDRVVSHGADRVEKGRGVGHGESGVGEGESGVTVSKSVSAKEELGLGVSLPLHDTMSQRKTGVSKSGVSQTGVSKSSVSKTSVSKTSVSEAGVAEAVGGVGNGSHGVVNKGSVVDERSGGGDDPGVAVKNSGVGLPLDNVSGEGRQTGQRKTSVSESGVSKTSVSKSGVSQTGVTETVGGVGNGSHGVVDKGSVVDEGSGGGDDPGVAVQHGGVGLPLAVVSVAVAVVADSDGDVVGGHLVADLSGGLDDGLDDRVVSHGADRVEKGRGVGHGESGVAEAMTVGEPMSAQKELGVGLGSDDCCEGGLGEEGLSKVGRGRGYLLESLT